MKNRMTRCGKRLAVFAAAVLSLAGCSDDRKSEHPAIWDFVNPSVRFVVTDAETGENLLDPASENFIGEEAVAVSYKGERYGIVTEPYAPVSRFNMPRPLALRLERDPYYSSLEELQGWHLSFGEFSPTDNYRDQRFTVEWEDGSTTEVEFDLYIVWHDDEPDVKSLVRVDGVDHGSGYDNGWVVRISR